MVVVEPSAEWAVLTLTTSHFLQKTRTSLITKDFLEENCLASLKVGEEPEAGWIILAKSNVKGHWQIGTIEIFKMQVKVWSSVQTG